MLQALASMKIGTISENELKKGCDLSNTVDDKKRTIIDCVLHIFFMCGSKLEENHYFCET
jgi:hypothetical protein